nr:MAG TPA: hypothetical protein [Bacteriophage sp.]
MLLTSYIVTSLFWVQQTHVLYLLYFPFADIIISHIYENCKCFFTFF